MNREYLQEATDMTRLPLACPGQPRVVARIKEQPEDFRVEEVNNFEATGDGPHLFLWVEKRDCPGGDLLRRLAVALGRKPSDIGYAGTKDRRAVTRQWLSVPGDCEEIIVGGIELAGIQVLKHVRHQKKLRLGHLAGNRFRILLRGADPDRVDDLARTGRLLEASGFPNFYGAQRFGPTGDSLARGLDLLAAGGRTRGRRPGRFELRMVVSAVQSALFNRYLLSRIEQNLSARILEGDVLSKTETGGLFTAEDVETEQARLEAGEIRITGPMFGHKFMAAKADAGRFEQSILDESGLTTESFKVFKRLARGTRRALFVRPEEFSAEADPDGIVVSFYLPRGTYASVLLRDLVNLPAE